MTSTSPTAGVRVHGDVASQFEPVARRFADEAAAVGHGGAAFAATVGGRLVVDLWAGRAGDGEWHRDTRGVVLSVTKQIATLAVGRLVDRGLIDVDGPVAEYWPEFAHAGKQHVTVAELLAHTAGLVTVPGYESFLAPDGTGWERTADIVDRLARAAPAWPPGSASGYHALTMGWLVGELVARAGGKSVGTVIREEIARPLGLDLDLGTPPALHDLVAPIIAPGPAPAPPAGLASGLSDPRSLVSRSLFARDGRMLHDTVGVLLNDAGRLAMELPFGDATATARSLAVLNGALASGGRWGDVEVMNVDTIKRLTTQAFRGIDRLIGLPTRWGLGIRRNLPTPLASVHTWGPHDAAFGVDGLGGQISFADPVCQVGVGFIRSHFTWTSALGRHLVESLYDCLRDHCADCRRIGSGMH